MSESNPSEFTTFTIDGTNRRTYLTRVELWRTVSGIGTWMALLRNPSGVYNATFDVQDSMEVAVNGNTLMKGFVDGPAVTLRGRDLESIWDEYVILKGVDRAQDLGFHSDFEYEYPDTSQQIKAVLDDVINTQLAGLTDITYTAPVGATPAVGSFEFREGASLLSEFQDLHKRAGYVFYVDDAYDLKNGAPGFDGTGLTLTSVAGSASNNILGVVDYRTRDGDKHYNYIKIYGKNPCFDLYTELNAADWTSPLGSGPIDDTATVRVGNYSQVVYGANPVTSGLSHQLALPVYNYTLWDFSKGQIGIWAKYNNTPGAPGTPGSGNAGVDEYVTCRLIDSAGAIADYYGESSLLYRGDYGFCTFPLGEKFQTGVASVVDQWCVNLASDFLWDEVVSMEFSLGSSTLKPSHFWIDGISLPIPGIAFAENAGAQGNYRKRPYIDTYAHLRSQNALQAAADSLLAQSESTVIDKISLLTQGNHLLRYAGQSFDLNIPALGINTEVFYITQLHHIIEPYVDVSSGFGFDWVTEIEAVPTSGVSYDMSRLHIGGMSSTSQQVDRSSMGLRVK